MKLEDVLPEMRKGRKARPKGSSFEYCSIEDQSLWDLNSFYLDWELAPLSKEIVTNVLSRQDVLAIYKAALNSIVNNPTSDSTGIINNENNWTRWAKSKALAALQERE